MKIRISVAGIIVMLSILFTSCSVGYEDNNSDATKTIQLNNSETYILSEIEEFLESKEMKTMDAENRIEYFHDHLIELSREKSSGDESFIKPGSVKKVDSTVKSIINELGGERAVFWKFNDNYVDEYIYFTPDAYESDNHVCFRFLYD